MDANMIRSVTVLSMAKLRYGQLVNEKQLPADWMEEIYAIKFKEIFPDKPAKPNRMSWQQYLYDTITSIPTHDIVVANDNGNVIISDNYIIMTPILTLIDKRTHKIHHQAIIPQLTYPRSLPYHIYLIQELDHKIYHINADYELVAFDLHDPLKGYKYIDILNPFKIVLFRKKIVYTAYNGDKRVMELKYVDVAGDINTIIDFKWASAFKLNNLATSDNYLYLTTIDPFGICTVRIFDTYCKLVAVEYCIDNIVDIYDDYFIGRGLTQSNDKCYVAHNLRTDEYETLPYNIFDVEASCAWRGLHFVYAYSQSPGGIQVYTIINKIVKEVLNINCPECFDMQVSEDGKLYAMMNTPIIKVLDISKLVELIP